MSYLWLKSAFTIRTIAIILLFLSTLISCIEVLPIPSQEGERKLFVVCEMSVGDHIHSNVSYTGTANGTLPKELEMPDTFNLSLAEGDKDFGIPFKFDSMEGKFIIEKNLIDLQHGVRYKFRGIGNNPNTSEPYVIVPEAIQVDSVIFVNVETEKVNDRITTKIQCILQIAAPETKPSYLYVVPKTESNLTWEVTKFNKDQGAYKRLHHRDGFLVDYTRLTSDEIHFTMTLTDTIAPIYLNLSLSHVTTAFFQYNNYLSNISTDPGQSAQIPAIAGFNINTEKAFGSFSAMNTTQQHFIIK